MRPHLIEVKIPTRNPYVVQRIRILVPRTTVDIPNDGRRRPQETPKHGDGVEGDVSTPPPWSILETMARVRSAAPLAVRPLPAGLVTEDWTGDAVFHEYSAAVDPLGAGTITPITVRRFPASLHASGPTGAVTLDLSHDLVTDGPATGPSLLAQFLRIEAGDSLTTAVVATSELIYCLRGAGRLELDGGRAVGWRAGDVLALPARSRACYRAHQDSVLYHVDDSPLLRYLGVEPSRARFAPTLFDGSVAADRLAAVAAEPAAAGRSRVAVLLGNAAHDQTLTATHTLWAMLGVLPDGAVQRPHRHQSIALDLIVDCRPGCYSLVGTTVDAAGTIVDAERVDWETGGAFVTPPGLWHSHHNESGAPAHLLPVQDAGLHTYLRTLDIRFTA
ncbi:MAG: cupin [Acidimicrobiales bacterium]